MRRTTLLAAAALALTIWAGSAAGLEARMIESKDGTPLQVIEAGPNLMRRPILFVHGFGMSSSSWLQQFDSTLQERLQTRGTGPAGSRQLG